MEQLYNVKDRRTYKKLSISKRFRKYPNMFLSNSCVVRVNGDDFLVKDEFIIHSKNRILPRKIFLYGKKTKSPLQDDNLYLNYWMPVFFKTIENGNLVSTDIRKEILNTEIAIGLPLTYRGKAFRYKNWSRKNVIDFLACLFNNEIFESNYEQQDLLDSLEIAA